MEKVCGRGGDWDGVGGWGEIMEEMEATMSLLVGCHYLCQYLALKVVQVL